MKHIKKNLLLLIVLTLLSAGLSSCHTAAPRRDYQALAQASIKLGVEIDLKDNPKLYQNAARWIGTPYLAGGTTRQGIDCSALSRQLYKETYRIRLSRSTAYQHHEIGRILTREELHEGDLVFFSGQGSPKKAAHVGVYLKEGKFIHASLQGVIVSSLDEEYYRKHWICGGRASGR